MKKLLLFIVNLFMVLGVIAQNNEQLELVIENDKLVFTDKYYTSGLFLTYKRDLQNSFVFKKKEDNVVQLNMTLGNETYTPTNLYSTNPVDFDRPYAGWLFLKTEVGSVKNSKALFVAVETGITGDESLAGKLQVLTHDILNIDDNIPWTQQIEFKFLVNLKGKYILTKRIKNNHAFHYVIESALGTKDIFVENYLGYYFGKFNSLKQSSRIGIVNKNTKKEFFGFINLGHKYVAHNTLIQGGLRYDDVLFTTYRTPHVFKLKIGGVLSMKKNTFKLILNYNTKETPESMEHAYGTFSFSRDF